MVQAVTPGSTPSDVPGIEHEHPDVSGGWLRPAVFGAMDGLVSNFALIAGIVGGTGGDSSNAVVLAGLAGLAAGLLGSDLRGRRAVVLRGGS